MWLTGSLFGSVEEQNSDVQDGIDLSESEINRMVFWYKGLVPIWSTDSKLDLTDAHVDHLVARFPHSFLHPGDQGNLLSYPMTKDGFLSQENPFGFEAPSSETEKLLVQTPYCMAVQVASQNGEDNHSEIQSICGMDLPIWSEPDQSELIPLALHGFGYTNLSGQFYEQPWDASVQITDFVKAYEDRYGWFGRERKFQRRIISDEGRDHDFWQVVRWIRSSSIGNETGTFDRQPYLAMERAFLESGRTFNAKAINMVMHYDLILSQSWFMLPFAVIYGVGYGLTTGFGNLPALALFWFMVLVLVGERRCRKIPDERISTFSDRFWYSMENALPLIDISHEHRAIALPREGSWFFYFQKIVGFVLVTIFVGVLTLA